MKCQISGCSNDGTREVETFGHSSRGQCEPYYDIKVCDKHYNKLVVFPRKVENSNLAREIRETE